MSSGNCRYQRCSSSTSRWCIEVQAGNNLIQCILLRYRQDNTHGGKISIERILPMPGFHPILVASLDDQRVPVTERGHAHTIGMNQPIELVNTLLNPG
jgi:hypothetical protein